MANKKQAKRSPPKNSVRTSWEPLASWYDGWMGENGSEHHRRLALPAVLELLQPQADEQILDLGCGQGVLAPRINEAQAHYTGIDASPAMIRLARKRHSTEGRFIVGDCRKPAQLPDLKNMQFDAAVFLLSIQDMHPLEQVVEAVAGLLKPGGRVVILMTHPCFRIPRQSGWGWDEGRKLRYRRIDRYLTSLAVPLKSYRDEKQQENTTLSYHHPLEKYINTMANYKLVVDCLREIPGYRVSQNGPDSKADKLANQEIPLFMGLRARKL
jgi:ubiquinone/menaquinone biosynthesis C-methylase UbiE